MKQLFKVGFLAFALGLIFIGVDTANAQYYGGNRGARREYRKDVRDARQDYRRRVNQGNYGKARREYREDVRDARRDYRQDTGRRVNRNYYNNRRYYSPVNRYYYRNGRRVIVRY